MLHLLVAFLITTVCQGDTAALLQYQQLCTSRAFRDVYEGECCSFPSVTCVSGIVKSIDHLRTEEETDRKIDLRWLPPMLQDFRALLALVVGFRTRLLPKTLERFEALSCGIWNSIDLPRLPAHMEHFDASSNPIYGTIVLVGLPPHLRTLDLRHTSISTVVGAVDALPGTLARIKISSKHKKPVYIAADEMPKPHLIRLKKS